MVNGGEPRLRGCIGSLQARGLINGFRDYALTRFVDVLVKRRFIRKAPSCSELNEHGSNCEITYNLPRIEDYSSSK